jgi:putative transferase (TIGR04331 family)
VIAGGFFRGVPERLWIQACRRGAHPSRLVIIQHGGNYGESADMHVAWTDIERRVSDTFVSWGWGGGEANVVPLPAPRLMGIPRASAGGDALLVVSGMVREYPSPERFTGAPSAAESQERFLAALPSALLPRVRFRGHPRDGGTMEQQAPWHSRFPEVSLDRGDRPMQEEIVAARLVVVTYPFSTAFPECVAADQPVMVISDGRAPAAHPRAREAYAQLHATGVVHHDAAVAAQEAGRAFRDVQAWWRDPGRRAAVEAYRRAFAWTADDAVAHWRGFLHDQVAPDGPTGLTTPAGER